jgi:hypothetical protein
MANLYVTNSSTLWVELTPTRYELLSGLIVPCRAALHSHGCRGKGFRTQGVCTSPWAHTGRIWHTRPMC